jgi:hypothetical protein
MVIKKDKINAPIEPKLMALSKSSPIKRYGKKKIRGRIRPHASHHKIGTKIT